MNQPATETAPKLSLNAAGQMAKPQHVKPAIESDVREAEQYRIVRFHRVADGVKPKDVMRPEYWANLIRVLRVGDRVEIVARDSSWEGVLSVRQILKAGVLMEWYMEVKDYTPIYKLSNPVSGAEADYLIQQVGGMHRILRKSDGQMVVGDSYPDEPTARNALRQFLGVKAN